MIDENDAQEQPVPQIITDEYMKIVLSQTDEFVKDLRSQENYHLANQVIKLVTVSENLQFQLKNEQQKIQELLEKFVDAGGRIEKAVKISQRDQDVIIKLRENISNAWSIADAAKLREQHVHESFNSTRTKYLALLEQNKRMATKYEASDELGENSATVLQECDRLLTEIEEYKKRLYVQRSYSEEVQKMFETEKEKSEKLFNDWNSATNESLGNRKKVEALTITVKEIKEQLETTSDNLGHFKKQSEILHKRLKDRERQIMEMREDLEKISTENSVINVAKSKLEIKLKSSLAEAAQSRHDMLQLQNFIRLKEDENKKLFNENERETKKSENFQRKISSLEKINSRNELEILNKKTEFQTVEKERDLIKKASDDLKKENEKFMKKIEHNLSDMEKLNASIHDMKKERQLILEEKALISADLKSSQESERKAQSNMRKLQSNLEVIEADKLFLTESMKQLNDDFEEKKKLLEKSKQELSEAKEQITHCKHEYSTALKNLKDTRADYQRCSEREADVKNRLLKCRNQVEDTNEKLAGKIEEISSLTKKVQKLEKVHRETKLDLERCEENLKNTRGEVKNLRYENKLQKDELRENDARFGKMKVQMDKTLRERDLIANQMFRKTDENGLLEQKVSTLKMSLDRGDSMYQERLDDIKIMKNEVMNLRSKCNVLKRGLENTFDMRHETLQLYRKLNQEKVKVKALEEEMLTPMNVHRWRRLGRRDPDRMTIIRKFQRFQKRSFMQMIKLSKYEKIIKEMEKKNTDLQQELARYSNVDIQRKLVETKSQLNFNTKRMKAAIALSRASEYDIKSKDNEINQLQKNLTDVKNQLFKEKREKLKLTEKMQIDNENDDFDLKDFGNKFKVGIMQ